jgi:hypothetical protein
MTTARKSRANQENAQASTGPKTAGGKARSARNACRHGLSIPIWSDCALATEAHALAQNIAGSNASPALLRLAQRIAEAQIDLVRVRNARLSLIAPALSELPFYTESADVLSLIKTGILHHLHGPPSPIKVGFVLSKLSKQLEALDRYERRTLSRRKFAIRDFESARLQKFDIVNNGAVSPA